MAKSKNICKAVPNKLNGVVRAACSKCGGIFTDDTKGNCPHCKKRIKPSKFTNKFCR